MWWHIPLILTFEVQRRVDFCDFKAILVYILNSKPAKAIQYTLSLRENNNNRVYTSFCFASADLVSPSLALAEIWSQTCHETLLSPASVIIGVVSYSKACDAGLYHAWSAVLLQVDLSAETARSTHTGPGYLHVLTTEAAPPSPFHPVEGKDSVKMK